MAGGQEEQAGLARIWSASIGGLAVEAGRDDELADELESVVELFDASPDVEALLTSPVIDDETKRALIEKALRGRASDLLVDALQVMREKDRLGIVRAVTKAYRSEWLRRRNRVEVQVATAVPLTDELRDALRRAASKRTGMEASLVERVDPSLLGGLVVTIDDQKFDDSVSRELDLIEERLLARASHELHSGKTYFEETV